MALARFVRNRYSHGSDRAIDWYNFFKGQFNKRSESMKILVPWKLHSKESVFS